VKTLLYLYSIQEGCLKSKSCYDWRSVSQYVLVSSPLWNLWPDIIFCLKVAVLSLWGAEVEAILRPTVSRPVRLGVLPLLEQVTRCYIYLSDNYFLYFSCRVPSLKRGRVCNLQCNDASSISSYTATDGLPVRSSWCRTPNGTHNQILISLFGSYFVFSV
jgi:hypothetical protein